MRGGTIEGNIGRDAADRLRMAVVDAGRGKPAVTHYRVCDSFPTAKVSLLELKLETGRTHQIRVHLAAVGCPLLGDDVYVFLCLRFSGGSGW